MKRRLVAGGIILIAIAILAMGTYAYLVDQGRARNIITTGTVQMTLTEYEEVYSEGQKVPQRQEYDNEIPKDIMPGESISKIPVIENTGTAPFWARIKVEINLGDNEAQYRTVVNPLDYISLENIDADKWTYVEGEDGGWYYYKTPLLPGEEVEFFSEVKFLSGMGNEFQNKKIFIDVQADAIQSDNNPLQQDGDGEYKPGDYLWNAESDDT